MWYVYQQPHMCISRVQDSIANLNQSSWYNQSLPVGLGYSSDIIYQSPKEQYLKAPCYQANTSAMNPGHLNNKLQNKSIGNHSSFLD